MAVTHSILLYLSGLGIARLTQENFPQTDAGLLPKSFFEVMLRLAGWLAGRLGCPA